MTTHEKPQDLGPVKHRRRALYLRHAVAHPAHVLALVCLPFALFFAWSMPTIVTFAVLEAMLLVAVPQTPAFRRWVDQRVRAAEALMAARVRAGLLLRMTDGHRQELQHLEVLADALRERLSLGPSEGGASAVDDYLGIGQLLATYVGGAVAYCSGRACLVGTDREALAIQIQGLQNAVASGSSEPARGLAAQRLQVARLRAARWDRSYQELEVMQEQLALVGDVIRLLYEHAAAPVSSPLLDEEVRHALDSVRDGERMVRELADLLAVNDTPEPKVLQLGRQALAAMTQPRLPQAASAPPSSRVRVVPAATQAVAPANDLADDWAEVTGASVLRAH